MPPQALKNLIILIPETETKYVKLAANNSGIVNWGGGIVVPVGKLIGKVRTVSHGKKRVVGGYPSSVTTPPGSPSALLTDLSE